MPGKEKLQQVLQFTDPFYEIDQLVAFFRLKDPCAGVNCQLCLPAFSGYLSFSLISSLVEAAEPGLSEPNTYFQIIQHSNKQEDTVSHPFFSLYK